VICGCCALVSVLSGVALAIRHIHAGQRVTGTLAPSQRATASAFLVLSGPCFAVLSLLSVVLLELAPVWHLMQCFLLSSLFSRLPEEIVSVVGGRVRFQLLVKERQRLPEQESVQLYGQVPCCCLRRCIPPKHPDAKDLPKLRLGIWQICFFQPFLALIDLLIVEEGLMGAGFVRVLAGRRAVMQVAKVSSQLFCMSSVRGLAVFVDVLNKNSEMAMQLQMKQRYCQCYLLGMNLIPTLLSSWVIWAWGSRHLENHLTLAGRELTTFSHSLVVCIASLLISRQAWRAFPVDKAHYPAAFPAGSMEDATTSMLALKRVAFCPFCGSSALRLNTECSFEEPTMACDACGAQAIPCQLEARTAVR